MTETTKAPMNIETVASMVLGADLSGVVINAKVTKDRLKLSTKDNRLSMDLKIDQSPVYLKDGKEEILAEGNWTLTFGSNNVVVTETPKVTPTIAAKAPAGKCYGCATNPRFAKEF